MNTSFIKFLKVDLIREVSINLCSNLFTRSPWLAEPVLDGEGVGSRIG